MAKDKALPPLPSVEKKLMITIPRELGMTPYKQYCGDQKAVIEQKKLKEEQKKKEEEQICFQNECWDELRKARCKEYVSFQNMIAILKEICTEPLRWIVINTYIQHHQFNTKGAHMALKHCSGVLSAKERNQLQHMLNGNIDIPTATFAAAILAGITYPMRRNRTTVVAPLYDAEGTITGVMQRTAVPSVADLMEENTQAEAAAQTVGQALAEIVNTMRNEHRTLQQQLQANQQEFETQLAAENCQRDAEERERA